MKSTLLLMVVALFWLLAGLSFSDRINVLFHYNDMEANLYESIILAEKIQSHNNKLIELASPGKIIDSYNDTPEGEQLILKLLSNIKILSEDEDLNDYLELKRKINLIEESCQETSRLYNEFLALLKDKTGLTKNLTRLVPRESIDIINEYLLSYNPEVIEDLIDEMLIEEPQLSMNREEDPSLNIPDYFFVIKSIIALDNKLGYYHETGLTGDILAYSNQISTQINSLLDNYKEIHKAATKNYLSKFFFLLSLTGILIFLLIYFVIKKNLSDFEVIKLSLNNLSEGRLKEDLRLDSDEEFSELRKAINKITAGLLEKKKFAASISEGDDVSGKHEFSECDELGNELDKMAQKLEFARKEDLIHKEEERKRSWHSEGLANFGEIFRSERDDVSELAFKVIQKLVKYLDAIQGSLFILNDEDVKNPFLETIATFAFDRRKYLNSKIEFGVGLIGTCAIEKETIYINEVPEDYIQITSGLGETPPRALLIVPLKLENEIFGIIEIATLSVFKDFEIRFTEQLAESISTTLAAVRINAKTAKLLKQSQLQTNDMAEQEEKMRKNVQALERAQDESKRKEIEISGILNAVNASSLVAEFSLNGRFSELNERFVEVFEISKEQFIGKHHSDFADVDKYSEDYKKFWRDLREGEIISRTEKFKLFSGKEIWLKETYTPIQDENGKTLKILNISHDITQTRIQQHALEKQASEIARSNIEMKSLSSAVDKSIIKCEYSSEGIIMNVNDNYCEVTGYSMKELIGKNVRLYLKEDEKSQFDSIISEILKEKSYSGVVKRTKPIGEEKWLMANFTAAKDEEGNIYKIYLLAQDVTEKKLKYQLLEEANKEITRLKDLLNTSQKK